MQLQLSGISIEVTQGDIVKQADLDAVVNAANAQLRTGGGVAGAIHRAAGSALDRETRPLAPIEPGQAVVTGGHNLPNSYIIHCLGPRYGIDRPADKLLADAYRNALTAADQRGMTGVGFPALSTGAFGYPMEEAARIAARTIRETAPRLTSVRTVRFVLVSEKDYSLHARIFGQELGG